MNSLRSNIRNNTNKAYTENGDLALRSTFNKNLDFFALASSLRKGPYKNYQILRDLLDAASTEDKNLLMKNIFFLRDVRGGNKERDLGRYALTYISNYYPNLFIKVIPFIPEIGRYDDLTYILYVTKQEIVKKAIAEFIGSQLFKDFSNPNPSLMAKWLPTTDAGKRTKSHAKALANELQTNFAWNPYQYHRIVKKIRKKLNLLETKITEENFSQIDYSKVAGQAMLKNKELFRRKDGDHFSEYETQLSQGNIKAKTDTMTPVQILENLLVKCYHGLTYFKLNDELAPQEIAFINNIWRDLDRNLTNKNIIVVRDGSGSMMGEPLNVASALAIYASECLTGVFKDSFITFSAYPELIEFPEKATSLSEKIKFLAPFNDCSNTNIEKVYNLILNSSIGIPEEDQIDTIVIVSDMQFDSVERGSNESTYENAKRKFNEMGVKFPHVVFWNVNARHVDFPASNNDNVSLVSGYSSELFKEIIKNEVKTPTERMLSTLSRYDYLDDIL